MFLLTTGELIADIVAMAGIYCLGTFFRELLNSDIMAYLMIPVDVLLLILGIYILQRLRNVILSHQTPFMQVILCLCRYGHPMPSFLLWRKAACSRFNYRTNNRHLHLRAQCVEELCHIQRTPPLQ